MFVHDSNWAPMLPGVYSLAEMDARIDNFHYRLILKLGKEMQIDHLS